MDSPRSNSSESELEFSILEQNLSECLEREPSSPISRDVAKRKSFRTPVWGKHKVVVTIKEVDKDEPSMTPVGKEIKSANVAMAKLPSTANKIGLTGKIGETNANSDNNAPTRIEGKNTAQPIVVKETDHYRVSVAFPDLENDEYETPQQRSARLVFESKRKAFYLSEGYTHRKGHHYKFTDLPKSPKSPSPSEDVKGIQRRRSKTPTNENVIIKGKDKELEVSKKK